MKGKEKNHVYRVIYEVVSNIHLIRKISFQAFDPYEDDQKKETETTEYLVRTTARPLELMALFMNLLKDETYTDNGTFIELDYYIPLLWKRILSEDKGSYYDTLNILEILYSCTFENTFSEMVLPLIKEDPRRWLGATITTDHLRDDKYIFLLKSRPTHAIFGKWGNANQYLSEIKESVSKDDLPYVEEYESLVLCLADNILYKKDENIPEKYRSPEALLIEKYPLLSKGKIIGPGVVTPLKAALQQLASSPFWQNEDLRKERTESGAYFSTEI